MGHHTATKVEGKNNERTTTVVDEMSLSELIMFPSFQNINTAAGHVIKNTC